MKYVGGGELMHTDLTVHVQDAPVIVAVKQTIQVNSMLILLLCKHQPP